MLFTHPHNGKFLAEIFLTKNIFPHFFASVFFLQSINFSFDICVTIFLTRNYCQSWNRRVVWLIRLRLHITSCVFHCIISGARLALSIDAKFTSPRRLDDKKWKIFLIKFCYESERFQVGVENEKSFFLLCYRREENFSRPNVWRKKLVALAY